MRTRPLGSTGLQVSELALGAGPLGDERLSEPEVEHLIAGAVELGITLIDTAPSYGRSEHRIGNALRGARRDRVVLSTKLGYGVPGVPDWTGPCITGGIELALARLQTSWLDLAHLHSCPRDVLERGDVIDALDAAIRSGKLRVAAYSGDNDALGWAIDSGRFGVVQCSVNVADQRALDHHVPTAAARGIGVLAKRPLANAAWREPSRPEAVDRAIYWDRLRAMQLDVTPALALGFVLAQDGVSSVLLGTTSLEHLRAMLEVPALDAATVADIRARFRPEWQGVI